MGLREKVALRITVIMLMQVILVTCLPKNNMFTSDSSKQNQKRSPDTTSDPFTVLNMDQGENQKTRFKKSFDTSHETIRKTFNFPDVEYPLASTPRPHFYLQETNILQRNQIYLPPDNPPITTAENQRSNTKNMKYNNKKYKNLAKLKTPKIPEMTKIIPKFGTIYKEETDFPEDEYPHSVRDTTKQNYGKNILNDETNNNVNNNGSKNYSQLDINSKLNGTPSSNISFDSDTISTLVSWEKSNDLNTTPAPDQVDITTPNVPFMFTPYTTLYIDTTPSYITIKADENISTTPAPKKSAAKKKNKTKKKSFTKNVSLKLDDKNSHNDVNYVNSTPSHIVTTMLPDEAVLNKTQNYHFTVNSIEATSPKNFNKTDMCTNTTNQTTVSRLSSEDSISISPLKIHNNVKMNTAPPDNNIASISDDTKTAVSVNTDNKDSSFEDNDTNSNKSIVSEVDEEFTTDVFPDFDENMLSVSTSTMSPMTLVAFDEAWANSVVLDPYKSVVYPDELDQYYIAIP